MRRRTALGLPAALTLALAACTDDEERVISPEEPDGAAAPPDDTDGRDDEAADPSDVADAATDFTATEHGTVDDGWSMTFLPGSDLLLIAVRTGSMLLWDTSTGQSREVDGVPEVADAGQGGLHDVIPGLDHAEDGGVWLSWVRPHEAGSHGVVARARLDTDEAVLQDIDIVWEQTPASGNGHFSLRLLVDEEHLFITSGDRQEMAPAQDRGDDLGAILRLTHDGRAAEGNPWQDEGGVAATLWSIGHRNPLGIARDADGRLWSSEMGPAGGDELNLIEAGANHGWPEASMGEHYDGTEIPDHSEGDGFTAPVTHWVPSISPGSLLLYRGDLFEGWQGSALLGGLSGECLARVPLDGESAGQAQQFDMGSRIRALAEAPDGAIWVLEDGAGGRLLQLRPA